MIDVRLPDVYITPLAAQRHRHRPVAITHPRLANFLDAGFEVDLASAAAAGFARVDGCIDLKHAAGPPDRYPLFLANPDYQLAL